MKHQILSRILVIIVGFIVANCLFANVIAANNPALKKDHVIVLAANEGSSTANNKAASMRQTPVHSYKDAVKLAAPSVVNIYTLKYIHSPLPPNLHKQMYPRHMQAKDPATAPGFRYRRKTTLGSGVIMDKEGYILTNYHLIRNARKVLVALLDGRKTMAKIIGGDPETDLAVLRIKLKGLTPIELGSMDDINVGDVVLAIGNPFGLGQTVTQGIISAVGRSTIGINPLETYIQTDAAINPGNSGGALINTRGKLIGINTGIYSRTGGNQGVGFAIPVDVALNIMNQIIKHGKVKRGWLGLEISTLTPSMAQMLGSQQSTGVVITKVLPKTPAGKAGLKVGDIILYVNRHRVHNARGFLSYIAQKEPGKTVALKILRKNKERNIEAVLGIRPAMEPHAYRPFGPPNNGKEQPKNTTPQSPEVYADPRWSPPA